MRTRQLDTIIVAYVKAIEPRGVSIEDAEDNLMPEFTRKEIKNTIARLIRNGDLGLSKGGRIRLGEPSDLAR
jgi:hypothetical protein